MAVDLDNFPIYDAIIRRDQSGNLTDKLSDNWMTFIATFIQTLTGYLSQNGIFVPQLTTAQRDDLQNVIAGQLIYNTTTNKFQGYEAGAWVNLV